MLHLRIDFIGVLAKTWWILCFGVSLAVTAVIVMAALEQQANVQPDVRVAKMGEVVAVGDLDLAILGTGPFAPGKYSFSEANYAVRFRATNARGKPGKPYELAHTDMKVLDNLGSTRDTVPCVQCPGLTGDDVSIKLSAGETVEGTFYYKLPPGMQTSSVTYRSLLSKVTAKVHVTGAQQGSVAPAGGR